MRPILSYIFVRRILARARQYARSEHSRQSCRTTTGILAVQCKYVGKLPIRVFAVILLLDCTVTVAGLPHEYGILTHSMESWPMTE